MRAAARPPLGHRSGAAHATLHAIEQSPAMSQTRSCSDTARQRRTAGAAFTGTPPEGDRSGSALRLHLAARPQHGSVSSRQGCAKVRVHGGGKPQTARAGEALPDSGEAPPLFLPLTAGGGRHAAARNQARRSVPATEPAHQAAERQMCGQETGAGTVCDAEVGCRWLLSGRSAGECQPGHGAALWCTEGR